MPVATLLLFRELDKKNLNLFLQQQPLYFAIPYLPTEKKTTFIEKKKADLLLLFAIKKITDKLLIILKYSTVLI